MRFIPPIIHGIADYVVGVIVVALPYVLGWEGNLKFATLFLGGFVVFYSAVTDYDMGLFRYLTIRVHLWLDALFGFAMLVMPGFFSVSAGERNTFYVIGTLALILTVTTKLQNSRREK